MDANYQDPRCFNPKIIFNYLKSEVDPQDTMDGVAKRHTSHFLVLERRPGSTNNFLTIGGDSDYPEDMLRVPQGPDSVAVASLIKEKLTTWAAIDWLANLLTKVLGRKVLPEQIQHSGLKDRTAITAQTIVVYGVTVEELKLLRLSYSPGKPGFCLKDIRWHDARQRLHPPLDPRRNKVRMEVVAQFKGKIPELARLAQCLSTQLGRQINHRKMRIKTSAHQGTYVLIPGVSVSELQSLQSLQSTSFADNSCGQLVAAKIYRTNCLTKGDHRFNRFQIKVLVPGKRTEDVAAYLEPRMKVLEKRGFYIPNSINNQRLSARQTGHLHGRTLITGEYKAPVKPFGSSAEAAIYRFLFESSNHERPEVQRLRRSLQEDWLYNFPSMEKRLRKHFRQFNMSVEMKLVQRLADFENYQGDFRKILRSMSEECSLWVAAWQSYWWNNILARKLPHWTKLLEEEMASGKSRAQTAKSGSYSVSDKGIPVLMDSPEILTYYGRMNNCKAALEDLAKCDDFVRELFLRPREDGNPWRKAFTKVSNLSYKIHDNQGSNKSQAHKRTQTEIDFSFDLSNGSYATTFLGLFFNLDEPKACCVQAEGALIEETE